VGLTARPHRGNQGYTLTNLLVASTIGALVLGALFGCYLFGLRVYEICEAKLASVRDSPQITRKLGEDLSSVKKLRVGSVSGGTFVEIANNTLQRGSAIQIQPTTNVNLLIWYYLDTADKTLKRKALDGIVTPVALSVSNSLIFTFENAAGEILTNRQARVVVGVNLQFSGLGETRDKVGAKQHFTSYQIQTKWAGS
jgi:hypothetical protein